MAKLEQGILGPFRGKVGTVVGYLWRGRHVVRGYRREINYPNTENQQAERDWFVSMVRFAATARQALLLGLRERAARDQMTEGNAFVKMNKHCFGRTHAPVAACGGATPSSLEGELKCLQSNSSPKLGEVPEGRRSVLQDGGGYGSKATRPRPSGTPSSLEGELKCRDAACRVRNAPTGIPNSSVIADAARCVPTEYERIRISEGAAAPVRFAAAEIGDSGILRVDFEKNSGMSRAKGSDRVYLYIYNTDSKEGLLSHPAERRSGRLQVQLPDGWNHLNIKLWGFVVDKEGRASRSAFVEIEKGTPEEGPCNWNALGLADVHLADVPLANLDDVDTGLCHGVAADDGALLADQSACEVEHTHRPLLVVALDKDGTL